MLIESKHCSCVWWGGSRSADQGQHCKAGARGSLPAMARAQAVETATAKQYQEDSAGKGNELHWPVGFPPSQCVLLGRCRNKDEF